MKKYDAESSAKSFEVTSEKAKFDKTVLERVMLHGNALPNWWGGGVRDPGAPLNVTTGTQDYHLSPVVIFRSMNLGY